MWDVTPCSLALEEFAVSIIKTDRSQDGGRKLLLTVATNILKYKTEHSRTYEWEEHRFIL